MLTFSLDIFRYYTHHACIYIYIQVTFIAYLCILCVYIYLRLLLFFAWLQASFEGVRLSSTATGPDMELWKSRENEAVVGWTV